MQNEKYLEEVYAGKAGSKKHISGVKKEI